MVEDLMTESSLTDLSQIGYRIRSEREKNGWSISEVSAYLRINEKILKAIEEGRTEEGIAPVFMRGFIRSYLRYLKLWDDSMDTPLQNTPELKQNAIKPVFQKSRVPEESNFLKYFTVLLFVLGSGYLIYAYYFAPEIVPDPIPVAEQEITEEPQPTPQAEEELVISKVSPALPAQASEVLESIAAQTLDPQIEAALADPLDSNQDPILRETLDNPEVPADSGSAPANPELPESSTEGEAMQSFVTEPEENKPLPLPPMELLISATERTWMSIALDGDEYLDVQFDAGESYIWEAKESFRLTLGNTAVMYMMLDGREIEFDRSKSLLEDWVIHSNPNQ